MLKTRDQLPPLPSRAPPFADQPRFAPRPVIARVYVGKGVNGLDENDRVRLITEAAKREYPTLHPDAAFSKLFSASVELRKFVDEAKQAIFGEIAAAEMRRVGKAPVFPLPRLRTRPAVTGGAAALGAGDGSNKSGYEQLVDLTNEQMRRINDGSRTFASVFSEIYQMNPELARRERAEAAQQLVTEG